MPGSPQHLSLANVDPAWAWSPFVASEKTPWNRAAVAHLYRRAGFSAGFADLDRALKLSPAAAIDRLLSGAEGSDEFNKQVDEMSASTAASNKPENLAPSWLYRMVRTPY